MSFPTANAVFDGSVQGVVVQAKKKDMKKQIDALPGQGISKFCSFRGDAENLELKTL